MATSIIQFIASATNNDAAREAVCRQFDGWRREQSATSSILSIRTDAQSGRRDNWVLIEVLIDDGKL